MRRLIPSAAACMVMLVAAGQAQADFVTVNFEAEVTDPGFFPVLGFTPAPGDAVTGQFTYDTGAADSEGSVTAGEYLSGSATFTIGGVTISTSGPLLLTTDTDSDTFSVLPGAGSVLVNDTPDPLVGFLLVFSQPVGLPDDRLPGAAGIPSFQVSTLQFIDGNSGGFVFFDSVTSISATEVAAVPEPSSLALLGAGAFFSAIGASQRRAARLARIAG